MKNIGYLVIILILSSGCKKDESIIQNITNECTHEIEEPGDYFPAYPKSWWKYTNQDNDTIVYKISSIYKESGNKCRPVFVNIDKFIYDKGIAHSFYAIQSQYVTYVSPIYSFDLHTELNCLISFATLQVQPVIDIMSEETRYKRIPTNLDTSLTIDGVLYVNVIEIYEYDVFNPDHRYFDYLAKDIGLIKRDLLNINDTTDHIQILKIEDYYIGN